MNQRYLTDLDIKIIILKSNIEVANFPKYTVRNRSNTIYMNMKNRRLIMLSGFFVMLRFDQRGKLDQLGIEIGEYSNRLENIGSNSTYIHSIEYLGSSSIPPTKIAWYV